MEVCLVRKPNIVQRYLIILNPFSKCHSLVFVLNTVILYGYKFKSLFNICCTNAPDIPSCAAAFLVDLLGFLCSSTLMVSVFSGGRADEGQQHFLSNTEPPLLKWL
jgi:hypothetical protein